MDHILLDEMQWGLIEDTSGPAEPNRCPTVIKHPRYDSDAPLRDEISRAIHHADRTIKNAEELGDLGFICSGSPHEICRYAQVITIKTTGFHTPLDKQGPHDGTSTDKIDVCIDQYSPYPSFVITSR